MAYDPSQLYIDPILTGFSVGFQDEQLYAERLAPPTRVNSKSGRYRVFDRSNWLIYRSRREPGASAREIGPRRWSEDTFGTQQHALKGRVMDEERRELNSQGGLADPVFGGTLAIDPERDVIEDITRSLLLEQEQKISVAFRNTANYASNHHVALAGSQKWSDYTFVTPGDIYSIVSNPVADLRAACFRVYLDTLRWPNTVIMPIDTMGVIENHPRVVDRFKTWTLLQNNAWEQLMGVPSPANIFIVDSRYNSAQNIDAPENIQSFWGQDVWVGLVDPVPGQKTKTFAKTFVYPQPDGSIRAADRWRDEDTRSDMFRTTYEYDVKIVSNVAGYLIQTAVAAIP
jgi:hypothetical protein